MQCFVATKENHNPKAKVKSSPKKKKTEQLNVLNDTDTTKPDILINSISKAHSQIRNYLIDSLFVDGQTNYVLNNDDDFENVYKEMEFFAQEKFREVYRKAFMNSYEVAFSLASGLKIYSVPTSGKYILFNHSRQPYRR